ncbi:MAG TPA: PAS domain S-box protein [Candidatus Udaeobacter sp.]|nr:PAS domain S-box protein [Candidatus Udaeobacter sp.]
MSWVTVIWSIGAGACLMLAFLQFIVWWKDRAARANLVFAVGAVAVAVFAGLELALMRAETPAQFDTATRWIHVPAWVLIVSIVAFVRLYLNAGRRWLAWTVVAVRTLALILNFAISPNINYRKVTALRQMPFLGEPVSVPVGVPNPWMLVAQFSLLLLVIFVLDATITVWRRGNRRQALVVGGSIVLLVILASAQAVAMTWGIMATPLTVSLFYLILVAAMAYELSYDLIRAARLNRRLQASEATLRESEQRFRIVADAAPVLIWMSGVDKLCTFFNKRWLEFTGRSLEQEMGNGWAEGVYSNDLQQCLQTYTEAFDARKPFVMQYRLRRNDGEYRWISDEGVPRYNPERKFVGYIGSCVDVTELLRQQKALHQFEERVALAAEAAHLGVWELNIATNRIWISDKVRELFQLPQQDEISYVEFVQRVHPADRAARDQITQTAIRSQSSYETEYRIVLPDGRIRWIGGRGRCLSEGDGKSTRLLGVSMDITKRKQAEELFELATEASPSGTVLVDHQGRIILVNAHIEELFGYARDELIGKAVDVLVPERFAHGHAAHRANFFAAPEARAMGAGRELFARRKDGSEFPVEIGLNPIQTPHGLVVLANVVDISARLAAEEVARRSREQVELLSRVSLLGEMTASLAHELNQPLAAIVNNATAAMQYLEQGKLKPEQLQDILNDVVADGRRACDVMHNVRGAIKKGSVIRGQINLNDVIKSVAHMVQADAAAQSCKMELHLTQDLPAVEGDPTQIQQVLINLVLNAFDAMRDAPPSRRVVDIATNSNGDGTIGVAVRDYGSGISETTRERLFEQFFSTKDDGLGMGLAIVRSIIEAHGGTVTAENAKGGGARFCFRLPISEGVTQ